MVVKRTHTNANVAPAVRKLREQVNAAYPDRDKRSDGIWPSAAHTKANPKSDHEAGNALDIDNELGGGVELTHKWLEGIRKDKRTKYVIHDGKIGDRMGWRAYSGSNPHKTHAHISVLESSRGLDYPWEFPNSVQPVKGAAEVVDERQFFIEDGDAPSEMAAQAFVEWAAGRGMKAVRNGVRVRIQGDEVQTRTLVEPYFKEHGFIRPWNRQPVTQGSYAFIGVYEPVPVVTPELTTAWAVDSQSAYQIVLKRDE